MTGARGAPALRPAMRRRRMPLARLGLLVLVLCLVAACGVRSQERPEELSTRNVGPTLPTAPSPSGPAPAPGNAPSTVTEEVEIYFIRQDRLAPVPRRVPLDGGLSSRIDALVAGPTAVEQAGGLSSAMPPGTRIEARVVDNVAVAGLPDGFTALSGTEQVLALAQLVYTLTAGGTVSGLQLTDAGKPIDMAVDGGRVVPGPVTRANYATVSPAAA